MDDYMEDLILLLRLACSLIFVLWAINKILTTFFHFVSSVAVVAALFAALYPPYKLRIPNVIEIDIGRFPIWDVPKSNAIASYIPKELSGYVPETFADMRLSLVLDQMTLLTNLVSVGVVYLIVLSIYVIDRKK
ncbi:hypothetical protein [Neptunomonas phycophila]|uniref:hypothetical protein n=1 Tax=Neptunomonas phycophila TaxID=1572645 RepID=UPI000948A9F1|nr:hypothetical protein [Neptunomonas phycophila]